MSRSDFLGAVGQTRLVATPVSFLEGHAILKTGNFRSAIPLFEKAQRENPNRLYTLQNLADAYLATGRKADARLIVEEAFRKRELK